VRGRGGARGDDDEDVQRDPGGGRGPTRSSDTTAKRRIITNNPRGGTGVGRALPGTYEDTSSRSRSSCVAAESQLVRRQGAQLLLQGENRLAAVVCRLRRLHHLFWRGVVSRRRGADVWRAFALALASGTCPQGRMPKQHSKQYAWPFRRWRKSVTQSDSEFFMSLWEKFDEDFLLCRVDDDDDDDVVLSMCVFALRVPPLRFLSGQVEEQCNNNNNNNFRCFT
jgi:hypothetical protein